MTIEDICNFLATLRVVYGCEYYIKFFDDVSGDVRFDDGAESKLVFVFGDTNDLRIKLIQYIGKGIK